jgi:tetratricopeptide (TPR) repeat protein
VSLRELARSGRPGVGIARGVEERDIPVVQPMYGTTILSDRPSLTWPAVAKAEEYQVELLSAGGKRLWRVTTKETRLAYPEKQAALTSSRLYQWRVQARLGEDKQELAVDSKFSVADTEEVKELAGLKPLTESQEPADWLLAATIYEAHGVYDLALPLYEKLATKFPAEVNFQVALASYYARAGRADQAVKARAKAKELGAVFPEK